MSVPAENIIRRARTIRSRRQIPAAAAAAAVTAGTAVAVTSLAAPAAAAWTVAKKPGGDVQVTIREYRDPAGLQRRLRADGVPATVRFDSNPPTSSQRPRRCLNYRLPDRQSARLMERILPGATIGGQTAFIINPSAIPARVGLWINVSPPARHGPGSGVSSAWVRLVYASGHCPTAKATNPSAGFFFIGGLSRGR